MQFIFRVHAIKRMFERNVSEKQVINLIQTGRVIREYPEDKPYPSCLILGWIHSRPLHVVMAIDESQEQTIVITVYEPDPDLWDHHFERKKC